MGAWDLERKGEKTSENHDKTPAKGSIYGDAQLIEGRLILVWHARRNIHIWDIEKGELLQTVHTPTTTGLRISEDGSKVFA